MSKMDEEEVEHWDTCCRTLLHYEEFVSGGLSRRQRHLNKLSDRHAALLPSSVFDRVGAAAHSARCNQDLLEDIVQHYVESGAAKRIPKRDVGRPIHPSQQHRNDAVLHSLHREWTADAKEERDAIFQPLFDALERHLPIRNADMSYKQRLLVPGCGAGRLPLELAKRGYCAEGNEFSAFMLLAANFILNGVYNREEYIFYPFADRVSNVVLAKDPTEPLPLPDEAAGESLSESEHYARYQEWQYRQHLQRRTQQETEQGQGKDNENDN